MPKIKNKPMCASFEVNGKQLRPGRPVSVWSEGKPLTAVWSGFARGEILSWWMAKGCTPVDVPAERFAERSRKEGRLVWGEMPPGMVIRGLRDASGAVPQILIVTRQASVTELEKFGHERMPLLEAPLFSAVLIQEALPASGPVEQQLDLF